eukprot:scaffold6420_cov78-Skeletonema_dohrnii-CCMP3373.AAC.2
MHYARAFVAAASFAYGTRRQVATSYSVMHQCTKSGDDESSPTMDNLLQRAQKIRREMYGEASPSFMFDHDQLSYPQSSYVMKLDEGILKRRNSKSST